jgi:hypothetical protein
MARWWSVTDRYYQRYVSAGWRVSTVPRQLLPRARPGNAGRPFKDVLDDYPSERERWLQLKRDRERDRALEWLQEEGIEIGLETTETP